jgi:hypothetical protein
MEIFSQIQPGCTYAGYHPWQGHIKRDEVRADFTKKFGYEPAEVLWCKPGMWMAGPLEEKTATASAVEANAVAEAQAVGAIEPADSVPPTGPDGQTQPAQLSFI